MARAIVSFTVLGCLALTACKKDTDDIPPRAHDAIVVEPRSSLLAVPIGADLATLAATIDRGTPRTLWTIDKPGQTCVKSRRVDLGIAHIKTPTLKCRIVGEVRRGKMTLAGKGQDIILTMPVYATIHAEDIGGVLRRETATADALARMRVKLSLGSDWTPRGTVDIAYDWTNAPHLQFLGQRIDLTDQADRQLAPVVARLERELPGQLGRLKLRKQVLNAWNGAFTTLLLNRENPPVWMRIKPVEVQYGGYSVDRGRIVLRAGLKAITETYVGHRPQDAAPTPLPSAKPLEANAGKLSFFIPVVADYDQLQPVLAKALRKRSARPFEVPGVGQVTAKFGKTVIYGTTGGRIAVGLTFTARDNAGQWGQTSGVVWMTGIPVNADNSRKVSFDQFAVTGTTDMRGGDLILRLANTPGMNATLANALSQNFENDFQKLLKKIQKAIKERREGDLEIRARVADTKTGRIKAAGRGVYLPVWVQGEAEITLARR